MRFIFEIQEVLPVLLSKFQVTSASAMQETIVYIEHLYSACSIFIIFNLALLMSAETSFNNGRNGNNSKG